MPSNNPYYVIFIVIGVFTHGTCSTCTPKLERLTTLIILRQEVILRCMCEDKNITTVNWLKGSKKKQITESVKYNVTNIPSKNSTESLLTIRNFWLEDFDIYTCEFDFQGDSNHLFLDKRYCLYIPDKTDINVTILNSEATHITIDVAKFYPTLSCVAFYNKNNFSDKMQTTVNEKSQLFTAKLIILFYLNPQECGGTLDVECFIETMNIHVVSRRVISKCEAYQSRSSITTTITILVAAITIIIVGSIVCSVIIIRRRRKAQSTLKHKYYEEISVLPL